MLEQSCTFVNAYYGILDYEWLKPQYIGGTHKNTGCPFFCKTIRPPFSWAGKDSGKASFAITEIRNKD